MWSETPDLNAETEDYDFMLDNDRQFASTFIPEMYAETPAIDDIFKTRHPLVDEATLLTKSK